MKSEFWMNVKRGIVLVYLENKTNRCHSPWDFKGIQGLQNGYNSRIWFVHQQNVGYVMGYGCIMGCKHNHKKNENCYCNGNVWSWGYGCGRFEHVGPIQQHSHCDPLPDTRNGVGFMIFMPNLGQQAKRDPNDDIAIPTSFWHSILTWSFWHRWIWMPDSSLRTSNPNKQSIDFPWPSITILWRSQPKLQPFTSFHYVRWLPSLHSPPAPAPPAPAAPKRVQVCRWMGSTASVVGWTNPGSDLTWEAKPWAAWAAWAAWAVQWRHKVEHLGQVGCWLFSTYQLAGYGCFRYVLR